MGYTQITRDCLGAGHRLSTDRLAVLLERADEALRRLGEERAAGTRPHFALPYLSDDLVPLRPQVEQWRGNASDVVVLGTGGSALGAQALAALVQTPFGPPEGAPRLRFLDNLDPAGFEAMLKGVDLKTTRFLVVSKSGGTAETLCQITTAIDVFRRYKADKWIDQHFVVITEPDDNPLRRLAKRFGLPTFDHDPGLGGRWSVLSLVGLMPAMLLGIDPLEVRRGAAAVLDQALSGAPAADVPAALGAAISLGLAEEGDAPQAVMVAYADGLERFVAWWRQLWAESLGKAGHGTTPVAALGPVDQHSQLQLWLDGPADKFFTFLGIDTSGKGPRVPTDLAGDAALGYLAGRTMGDLAWAEYRATVATVAGRGRPVREFRIDALDPGSLGALLMHFMLETLVAADLLGVDPFDQPAVEEGKILTRRYLSEAG